MSTPAHEPAEPAPAPGTAGRRSRLLALARRPAPLAAMTTFALAALLVGGYAVSAQVSGRSVADEAGTSSGGSPAPESGGNGGDNTAVAVNTRDGSEVYAIRLKVVTVQSDVVDPQNAAVAAASCTDCTTVAIALEGVLITGDAEVVAPENIALAINSGCDGCQTLAYAYQNVQTTAGKVRLTGAGRKRIAELRQELNALRGSGLPIAEVKAVVDRVAREFAQVLRTEVVPIGKPDDAGKPGAQASSGAATGAPEAGASGSPDPAASSPAPAASPSPSRSPSPSPSSTAAPSPSSG